MRTISSLQSARRAKHARRRKADRRATVARSRVGAETARRLQPGDRLSGSARHRPLFGGVRGGIADGPAFPPFGDFVTGALAGMGGFIGKVLEVFGDLYRIPREPHEGGCKETIGEWPSEPVDYVATDATLSSMLVDDYAPHLTRNTDSEVLS